MKNDTNLPEGTLRSTFLPSDNRGGTKLNLTYRDGWYRVETRWERIGKRRKLDKAIELFEGTVNEVTGKVFPGFGQNA